MCVPNCSHYILCEFISFEIVLSYVKLSFEHFDFTVNPILNQLKLEYYLRYPAPDTRIVLDPKPEI